MDRLLQLKGKEELKFNKTDFGFATAVWAPSAEKDRFRAAVDWSNWVSTFSYAVSNLKPSNERFRYFILTIVSFVNIAMI